jgi:hypothetical protein
MASHHWQVHIFTVTDEPAQQSILKILRDDTSLTALGATTGGTDFVIVECPDSSSAVAADGLIIATDPGAELAHTSATATPWNQLIPRDEGLA